MLSHLQIITKNYGGGVIGNIPIVSPNDINNFEYDYIVISVIDTKIYSQIKKQLTDIGIQDNKIVSYYECPEVIVWGFNDISKDILTFFDIGYNVGAYIEKDKNLCGKYYCGVPILSPEKMLDFKNFGSIIITSTDEDYRLIEKELISLGIPKNKIQNCTNLLNRHYYSSRILWIKKYAEWINIQKIYGNVAECGVCTGDSAKFLNEYFCDRTLYLFDTFDGFAEQDVTAEINLNNSAFNNSSFNQSGFYAQTSVDMVLKKLNHPENVVIKKGYFPDSAKDIDDKFCFVNLDMDLYQPMLAGLNFFWDKMVEGGCILLHDYFHPNLPGVKQAVDDFEKQIGVKLHKTVIGDDLSIAILK